MNGSETIERINRETLEQHRQIHFYLDQIGLTLEGLTPDLSDVEPLRRLAAQLQGLQERLEEHQQTEERDGLFRALAEALPDSRVEIDRLVNEHGRMIEILELARIHAQRGRPSEASALRTDLERFIKMFRRHECEEERLLREAADKEARATD